MVTITAKLTPQAKRRAAARLKAAFDAARARGDRYFWFLGDWYNTKKAGESDKYWATHFKDNSKGAGASNVLTNVGGTFKGKKGRNGTYNSEGKWITFTGKSNAGPVLARGDRYNEHRGWVNADLPTDPIIISSGTNRGNRTTNTRTGVTVGNRIKLTAKEKSNYPRRNPAPTARNMNWDAADFVDALMPSNLIGNAVDAAVSKVQGYDYVPGIARSGFNPFGYAKDLSTGNAGGLALRGIDAYATLGAPGSSKVIDMGATKIAPKLAPLSDKSKYIYKRVLDNGDLGGFNYMALAGKQTPKIYGKYSLEAAKQSGVNFPLFASRWATRAALNANTGTAYFYKGSTPVLYDNVVDFTKSITPIMTEVVNARLLGALN